MKQLESRTASRACCPACDGPAATEGTLCSAPCVRSAVHEIEQLSLRRRRLAEQLEARDDRTVLERLDPRNRVDDGLRAEHDEVAARTNELMAALLATDRSALARRPDTAPAPRR